MPRWARAATINLAAEAGLAFLASVAFFVLAAAAIPVRDELVIILPLGAVYLYVVLVAAKRLGPLYGVPLGLAAGLALDSFYIPPTREFGASDWQNWLVIAIYLVLGTLIGMLGAHAQRRAEHSEQAGAALADEQAALRRVATLDAREAPPEEVFARVAEEVSLLLGAESAWMYCYEPDGAVTVVASCGQLASAFPIGMRWSFEAGRITGTVLRTGRTARIDNYAEATGALGRRAHEFGVRSAVGSPIVVEGRLWGAMAAATLESRPLPAGSESRIEEFTELVATAVSNMQARSDLAASRARIVAATDEERRRVVRDLHDGAQQRLVHTVVTLKMARRALEDDGEAVPELVTEALENAEEATRELRELAHGILPAVLTRGGLRAGVAALASRAPVPVDVRVSVDRLPPVVEATAYFIVAEALTNVAKHARAHRAAVTAGVEYGTLQVEIQDDGVGAAEGAGSGLLGLGDRLAVLEGTLRVESPPDGGTLVAAAIPLPRTTT